MATKSTAAVPLAAARNNINSIGKTMRTYQVIKVVSRALGLTLLYEIMRGIMGTPLLS